MKLGSVFGFFIFVYFISKLSNLGFGWSLLAGLACVGAFYLLISQVNGKNEHKEKITPASYVPSGSAEIKEKVAHKNGYHYIQNFTAKYGMDYPQDALDKLFSLLQLNEVSLSQGDLRKLVIYEYEEQEYERFKHRISAGSPDTLEGYVMNFFEYYGFINLDNTSKTCIQCGGTTSKLLETSKCSRCESEMRYSREVLDYRRNLYFLQSFLEQKCAHFEKPIFHVVANLHAQHELIHFEKGLANTSSQKISLQDVDSMSGFDFENFLVHLFRAMGYEVEHTKLSGDQGADLVVNKFGEKTVVQAKRLGDKVGNYAVQEVAASIKHYDAQHGMVVTNNGFTNSARSLAASNDVELIDRDALNQLIEKYS